MVALVVTAAPSALGAPPLGAPPPGAAPPAPAPAAPVTEIVVSGQHRGTVSPGLFGANLLWPHGSGGAFDATANRFYPGFVAAARRLGISAIRYPGGTTADSFHWARAIGPASRRRANEPFGMQATRFSQLKNLVDGPIPSTVGPDEFGRLLGRTGAVGNVVVNFATGTVAEAADFVAYMTAARSPHPSSNPADPSYWSALRARYGHPSPYDVTYWEVGNEQQVPVEYGWRAGTLVALGPHQVPCPPGATATCLYAFGGTTRFSRQPVGTFANEMPSASRSTGKANQSFFAYYPPVVPRSEQVAVAGVTWQEVADLSRAGPSAHDYRFSPLDGRITFGNGIHSAIPPRGVEITVSYESGPHAGFVAYYRAMKRMNPRAQICESEETDVTFLRLMGSAHPYDCVELHQYAAPRNVHAPLVRYEQDLMAYPPRQGATVARLQAEIRRFSGRDVPVVLTEYGQLVAPMPTRDPTFILSLDEALLVATQLREWIDHGLPLAEKYLLTSSPFLVNDPRRVSVDSVVAVADREGAPEWDPGLSIDSAMIAGPGPRFVVEPSGLALGLLHRLAGSDRLASSVLHGPVMRPPGVPVLLTLAAIPSGAAARLQVLVVNSSPTTSVRARLVFRGARHGRHLTVALLDGPSPTAYNTVAHPTTVRTTWRSLEVGIGPLAWSFPAHSVSLLTFEGG